MFFISDFGNDFGNFRTDCCRILMKCKEDSFMVRKSSVPNSYALSLFNHKKQSITHTLIEPRGN